MLSAKISLSAGAFLLLASAVAPAQAQDTYPSHAIDIIAGFGAGGTADSVARMMAQYLSEKWKVPINVVSKPGGNTVPAQLEVYNAAPDGYTLYADNIGSSSMLQVSQPGLPFKVMDRTFVATTNSNPMLLFVNPTSPIKTLKDMADKAKKDPGTFTWSAVGVAEVPMRQFFTAIGVDIAKTKPVTSSGSVAATVLVAGGNVDVGVASVGPSMSPIQAGLVRPLAVTSLERWPALPDVPTTKELGFPTMYVSSWIGVTGPPKLPADVIKKWNDEIALMMKNPEIVAKLRGLATEPDYMDSATFRTQVGKEIDNYTAIWAAK